MKNKLKSRNLFFAPLIIEVLNDRKLSLTDRVILSMVIELSKQKGHCFANNKHFANNLNCSVGTVSKSINKLTSLGYIISNLPDSDHGDRRYKRTVRGDLIYKAGGEKKTSSHSIKASQPSIKRKHKEIINKNPNYYPLSEKEEKEKVDENFKTMFDNDYAMYIACKEKYDQKYKISWNEATIMNFIAVINNLNAVYKKELEKIIEKKRFKYFVEIVMYFFDTKPKFFNDEAISTYLKFFEKVTVERNFQIKIQNLLDDGPLSNRYY